ncbi:hypothetical protein GPECTOR_78g88 [Gonium pectorale]|uniref:DFDF domain-containing protein n=1 Tax=Gonium pectorale TaxID=33097 RepID=A0A150G3L2_GONPE|nr:hypothetical protein GPECTOR_78g88 [Gonium pectorale]|eukprot:KXZ43900.1 hypothetical protein GPECTOR_78g88 [Gonium pectorale]
MGENYLNSLISLVSKSDIRYEGILFNINMEESSIALSQVRSFGTEGRRVNGVQVPPSNEVYDYIIFKGDDIKDLTVLGPPGTAPGAPPPPVAPASAAQKVAPQVQVAPAAPRAPPAPLQPPPKPSNYAQAAAGGRGGPPGRAPPAGAGAAPGATASPMPLPVPTEDFNFEEQNAKFKKDELAKEAAEAVKVRGSYSRDDFFDAISCETLERLNLESSVAAPPSIAAPGRVDGRGDGRQRAADARRLDMETFGGLGGLRHNYNYGGRGRGRGGRGRGDSGGRGGGREGGGGGGRGLRPHATGVPNGGRGGRGRN